MDKPGLGKKVYGQAGGESQIGPLTRQSWCPGQQEIKEHHPVEKETVKAVVSCKGGGEADRGKLEHRRKGLVEVNAGILSKALGKTYLVDRALLS